MTLNVNSGDVLCVFKPFHNEDIGDDQTAADGFVRWECRKFSNGGTWTVTGECYYFVYLASASAVDFGVGIGNLGVVQWLDLRGNINYFYVDFQPGMTFEDLFPKFYEDSRGLSRKRTLPIDDTPVEKEDVPCNVIDCEYID